MSQRRLIINADGFGFTPGVNQGICDAIRAGLVMSTSCVVNFPYLSEIKQLVADFPQISIGIHFNLSVGRPVSKPEIVPSLVDENGFLWRDYFTHRLIRGRIQRQEMLIELDAQARTLAEIVPIISHFDGHQNKHLYPPFLSAAIKIAQSYGIERMRSHHRYLFMQKAHNRTTRVIRYYLSNPHRLATHTFSSMFTYYARLRGFRCADRLITPAYVDNSHKAQLATWLSLMENLPAGTSEIYCHPGYPDDVLRQYARYVDEREAEIRVLTSEDLKKAVVNAGVKVISFHEL